MDTTESYVKMCEKAVEIQQKKEVYGFEQGSFFYRDGRLLIISGVLNLSLPPHVWLPRQDQLQEMVKKENNFNLTKSFRDWQIEEVCIDNLLHWSMEQLWLAFVMKKEYGKVWIGADWIKEEGENG
jgi:hypothetical protein